MTAATLGSLSLLIFDPITIITRTMTTALLPALNHTLTSLARALYPIPFLRRALFAVEGVLRGAVLPIDQPVFRQGLFLALLFAAILSLNRLAHRFWCRYLCPLGGLLGLLAKISLLRPAPASSCNQCGRCAGVCPVDAIHPERDYEVAPSECIVCLDCLADCPHSGYTFELQLKPAQWEAHDPSRRDLLAAVGATAASVLLLKTGRQTSAKDRALIRPPGVVDEEHFLSRCIRCSQCMKICPTSGLQPALAEAGAEGIWTPVLMPRRGYCEYGCSACGEICPSDAIPTLTLEAKRTQVLGLARIDKDRCLPWAYDTPCIVCEEMCPIPEKAIRLEETIIRDKEGNEIRLQRPRVMRDLCIGCGICEYRCPMGGEAAIRVFHQEPL
jgi:ferredoxin